MYLLLFVQHFTIYKALFHILLPLNIIYINPNNLPKNFWSITSHDLIKLRRHQRLCVFFPQHRASPPMLTLSFMQSHMQQIFIEHLPHSKYWGSAVGTDREYRSQGGREAQGCHHTCPGSHWWPLNWLFPLRIHATPLIFILYFSEDKSTPRRKFLKEEARESSRGKNALAHNWSFQQWKRGQPLENGGCAVYVLRRH